MSTERKAQELTKENWILFLKDYRQTKVLDRDRATQFLDAPGIDRDEILELDWPMTFLTACANVSVDDCKWAFDKGCRVDIADPEHGFDALSYAIDGQVIEAARFLVTKGANLQNQSFRFENSVLHQAIHYVKDEAVCLEFCKLLILAGADLNATDKLGRTAVQSLLACDPNKSKPTVAAWLRDEAPLVAKNANQQQQRYDIMMSYSWKHQKTVLAIKEVLEAKGYSVWMDVEKMSGSTLGAMAQAVENASVILMTLSEAYEQSKNYRLEGEYAVTLRKPIIPLMLQKGYLPRGWLGISVGSALYFDFSKQDLFADSSDKLLAEVGKQCQSSPFGNRQPASVTRAHSSSPIARWSTGQVLEWLSSKGDLTSFCGLVASRNIDGRALVELQLLQAQQFEAYRSCVAIWAPSASLGEVLRFAYELRRLEV